MKADLPELALALSRASTGIRAAENLAATSVLLAASQDLLRVSRCDGIRLAMASCACTGDLRVAVSADRLKSLLASCSAGEVTLEESKGNLLFQAGQVRAKLKCDDLDTLPRHEAPEIEAKINLDGVLAERIHWAEKLTRGKIDHNTKPVEQVVVLERKDGVNRVFARLEGGSMAAWYAGEQSLTASLDEGIAINKSLIALVPGSIDSVSWSLNMIGFESQDFAIYERRVECLHEERFWELYKKRPLEGAGFNAAELSKAVDGAMAVYAPDPNQFRSVTLEAEAGVLKVFWRSWAGEYEAEVKLFGDIPSFTVRVNADLLTKIVTSMKCPSLAVKDTVLWIWDGPSVVALMGIRV